MPKILVVDDRQVNREVIACLLQGLGHQVLEAIDGQSALERVRSDRPDLVICDVLMPTMDGYEFARQLRASPDIAETQVIFWTAHFLGSKAKSLAQSVGVSHVLSKPSEPQDILRVVAAALAEKPLRTSLPQIPNFAQEHVRLVTEKLQHAIDDLQLANQRLRSLIDLSLQLVSQDNPDLLFKEVCRGACELIGARCGAVGIRSIEADTTIHFATSGIDSDKVKEMGHPPLNIGVLGEVMRSRSATRVSEVQRGAKSLGLPRGFPVVKTLLAAPVLSMSASYGWICLTNKSVGHDFDELDEQVLEILAAIVGRSYEAGNVHRKARRDASEQMQTLARRLIEAQDLERRQLSRELHDRVGQNLTALSIDLSIVTALIAGDHRPELHSRMRDSIALVSATADTIENVMSELRPPMLAERGLFSALHAYAMEFSRRTGIEIAISGDNSGRSATEREAILYRIAQEALNNVAKHAHAKQVRIVLLRSIEELKLTVEDDGVGYDVQRSADSGRGILAMTERALAVGGRVDLRSAPGMGALVQIHIPVSK